MGRIVCESCVCNLSSHYERNSYRQSNPTLLTRCCRTLYILFWTKKIVSVASSHSITLTSFTLGRYACIRYYDTFTSSIQCHLIRETLYRVANVVAVLGWVSLIFCVFLCFPNSAWSDENLAEGAGQVGKMVEERIQVNQTQVCDQIGHPVPSK